MNNASLPTDFPSLTRRVVGGLASLSILDTDFDEERTSLPSPEGIAVDEDFGGLLTGLCLAIPAGLMAWAVVVAALIALK